jgi:integrase
MTGGVVRRHTRQCRTPKGRRCNCKGSFEAWVYIAREGGKVRKCFKRKVDAEAWRVRALEEANKGILQLPNRDGRDLASALKQLLEDMQKGRVRPRNRHRYKPSTVRNYEQHVRRRIAPTPLGSMRVREIRRLDVQEFVDELLGEGLAPSTVNNILNPVQVFYRRSVHREEIFYNPTEQIEVPNAKSQRPKRIASREEAAELLAAISLEERPIWATAFYAGLRRGELQALRCCDVDLERRTITVERGWDQYEGPITPKSEASFRTVPLLAPLREILAEHMERKRCGGEDLIFGRTKEAAFVSSTINKHAQQRWEALGLQAITMHECRHTFASLLIDGKVNPKALQTYMGHWSIQVTFDTYGHLLPGSREEVRQQMDEYLAHEAQITGAQKPEKLAHLAHKQNQQFGGLVFPDLETGANGFTER